MSYIFSPVVASVCKNSQELKDISCKPVQLIDLYFHLSVEPKVYSETIMFAWFGIGSQKENITNWEEAMPSFYFKKFNNAQYRHSYIL